jgi:SAM-dependent methyltransferase
VLTGRPQRGLVCHTVPGIISGMRLSRKVEKLFSREVLESIWEHAARRMHPVNAHRILATIDCAEFARLRKRHPPRPVSLRINRFEDASYWVGINVERAQDLWLDRTSPLRILDLGCGAGYFLYVCRFFGHQAVGLDVHHDPFLRATTKLLNVRSVISRVDRRVPLPDLGTRFDLVTAHRVCFHRIRRADKTEPSEWTSRDWEFFINDIRTRFLEPNGRLLLDFNPRAGGGSFFTPELRASLLALGARIFRSKALFAADPKQWPRFKQTHTQRKESRCEPLLATKTIS